MTAVLYGTQLAVPDYKALAIKWDHGSAISLEKHGQGQGSGLQHETGPWQIDAG